VNLGGPGAEKNKLLSTHSSCSKATSYSKQLTEFAWKQRFLNEQDAVNKN
jgi:hypothetical protein